MCVGYCLAEERKTKIAVHSFSNVNHLGIGGMKRFFFSKNVAQ